MSRRDATLSHLDAAGRLIAEAIHEAEQVLDAATDEERARVPGMWTYTALWRAAQLLAQVSMICREKM